MACLPVGVGADATHAHAAEVVAFSDITTTQLVEKLWAEASREKIETFHAALGLAPPC